MLRLIGLIIFTTFISGPGHAAPTYAPVEADDAWNSFFEKKQKKKSFNKNAYKKRQARYTCSESKEQLKDLQKILKKTKANSGGPTYEQALKNYLNAHTALEIAETLEQSQKRLMDSGNNLFNCKKRNCLSQELKKTKREDYKGFNAVLKKVEEMTNTHLSSIYHHGVAKQAVNEWAAQAKGIRENRSNFFSRKKDRQALFLYNKESKKFSPNPGAYCQQEENKTSIICQAYKDESTRKTLNTQLKALGARFSHRGQNDFDPVKDLNPDEVDKFSEELMLIAQKTNQEVPQDKLERYLDQVHDFKLSLQDASLKALQEKRSNELAHKEEQKVSLKSISKKFPRLKKEFQDLEERINKSATPKVGHENIESISTDLLKNQELRNESLKVKEKLKDISSNSRGLAQTLGVKLEEHANGLLKKHQKKICPNASLLKGKNGVTYDENLARCLRDFKSAAPIAALKVDLQKALGALNKVTSSDRYKGRVSAVNLTADLIEENCSPDKKKKRKDKERFKLQSEKCRAGGLPDSFKLINTISDGNEVLAVYLANELTHENEKSRKKQRDITTYACADDSELEDSAIFICKEAKNNRFIKRERSKRKKKKRHLTYNLKTRKYENYTSKFPVGPVLNGAVGTFGTGIMATLQTSTFERQTQYRTDLALYGKQQAHNYNYYTELNTQAFCYAQDIQSFCNDGLFGGTSNGSLNFLFSGQSYYPTMNINSFSNPTTI